MAKLDPFTAKRIAQFTEKFRTAKAQLPTLKDFADHGFEKDLVAQAVKEKILKELYVTLTSGAVVKGYKVELG